MGKKIFNSTNEAISYIEDLCNRILSNPDNTYREDSKISVKGDDGKFRDFVLTQRCGSKNILCCKQITQKQQTKVKGLIDNKDNG